VKDRTAELSRVVKRQEEINADLQRQIKERQAAEMALQESQQLYSAIASNFPNGAICVFDDELQYVFYDGKDLATFRMKSKQLIGKKLSDHLPQRKAQEIEKQLRLAIKGSNVEFDIDIFGHTFEINALPLKNIAGDVNLILMVLQDITNRKEAEEEIKRSLEKERELNELKSRFVTMASHEFRTPLSTILSSLSLIQTYQQKGDLAKSEKHFNRIKSNINNLTQVLTDFLSIGRLEEGKISYQPTYFSLADLLDDVVEEIRHLMKPGQELLPEFSGIHEDVYFDPQIVKNILINLMTNAIKYSLENDRIWVGITAGKEQITIRVKDEGIGIDEADQKHLFERFFRATNVMNIQGTGLGLNIVRKYLDLMDGKIEFKSQLNKGSEFTVTLPPNYADE